MIEETKPIEGGEARINRSYDPGKVIPYGEPILGGTKLPGWVADLLVEAESNNWMAVATAYKICARYEAELAKERERVERLERAVYAFCQQGNFVMQEALTAQLYGNMTDAYYEYRAGRGEDVHNL